MSESCLECKFIVDAMRARDEAKSIELVQAKSCKCVYNVGIMAVLCNATDELFKEVLSKTVISELIHIRDLHLIFSESLLNPRLLKMLCSAFRPPNALKLILDLLLLYNNAPDETYSILLNKQQFDAVSPIGENKFYDITSLNYLSNYRMFTPLQYFDWLGGRRSNESRMNQLECYAREQMEETIMPVMDDAKTGIIPDLIKLSIEYCNLYFDTV